MLGQSIASASLQVIQQWEEEVADMPDGFTDIQRDLARLEK